MALEYFLYTTDYNNTLVDRSSTSFTPAPPYAEIHIDFLIPQTQPLYLYRESLGAIILNDDDTINAYLEATAPPPQPDDVVIQETFTGYTATTNNEIAYISGVTDTKHNTSDFNDFTGTTLPAGYYNKVEINGYTGTTNTLIGTKLNSSDFNSYSATTLSDINTRVYRSGDTMTGSLNTSGNLTVVGAVTGSSVAASVLITTPVLNASTSISAPQISGSTCITTPISCATTRLQAPVVCGGTCVATPIVSAASCVSAPVIVGTASISAPNISGGTISENGTGLETKYLQVANFDGYSGETDTRLIGIEDAVTGNTEDIVQNADDIVYLSGQTDTKLNIADFNTFSGTTLPANYYNKTEINSYSASTLTDINTRVYRSGDTMTGSLNTSGGFYANQSISGTSIYGSVSMLSPTVQSISCLCSQGTTQLDGAVTAASTLSVSGDTTLGGIANFESEIHWHNPNTGGTLNDYGVKWDPITQQIRTIPSGTGGTANVYCYSDRRTVQNNTTTTNASYLSETWSLPAGCYEYVYNALYGNTSSNRCATVCFLFDGNVVGYCNLMKTNASTVVTTAYVTQNNELLTTGDHTVSIVFRQQGGGTAFIDYGVMRVQKIGEID